MKTALRKKLKHWPLIIAICILWLTAGILFFSITKKTGGHFAYTMDDPYIHMSMAKNFYENRNWGITRYEFSSTSSSLLWTLLLSATYFIFGVNEASPLILNVLAATLVIGAVYLIFLKLKPAPPPLYILAALTAMTFATELPSLIFTGMESSLQVLLVVMFAHFSSRLISREDAIHYRDLICLLGLGLLITLVRFEGLSLIFTISILFMSRKRWKIAAATALVGVMPIVVYGLVSTSNGGFWLPNSVLLKASSPDLSSLSGIKENLSAFYYKLMSAPEIFLLILPALVLYIFDYNKKGQPYEYKRNLLLIFLTAGLLQAQFSNVGSAGVNIYFFRYEAYIVALGLLVLFVHVHEFLPLKMFQLEFKKIPKYSAAFLLVSFPVFSFSPNWGYLSLTPSAALNIYQQQYQIGLFLKQFYQNKTVVLNDIGAANYLCDIKCVDLIGLGSDEVAKERIKNVMRLNGHVVLSNLSAEQMLNLTQNADIAVIYDAWFPNAIPPQWEKVGEWEIQDNVACGGSVVSFYAANPSEKEQLIFNLKSFSEGLPSDVIRRL